MLDQILASTRARVATLHAEREVLPAAAAAAPAPRSLATALGAPGLQVIAEIKRRSPSAGQIASDLDAAAQARRYADGGAAAISVLTEPDFFGGSLADLAAVRDVVEIPVLRKDFIVDPVQVWEGRAAGADAVLLIVAALGPSQLRELLAVVAAAGMEALVEVHTPREVDAALAAGAETIGVNNRDLATFITDLAVAEAIAPTIPDGVVTVGESGVSSVAGARRMAAAGYDAILVGEAVVRSADPAGFIAELRAAGS
jgi:indole-3-glycerol phosphate synthase